MSAESIVERLKRETHALHEEVEHVVGIMHPEINRSDYVKYLSTLLGYYAPLERKLLDVRDLHDLVPDLDLRWKLPLLRQDLRWLGYSEARLASIARCQKQPAVSNAPVALGVLYVLEGSTLGGQIICRRLHLRLPAEVEAAASFLTGYAMNTGSMWQEFRRSLTACAGSAADEDLMVAAARETFISMKDWFDERSNQGAAHEATR